MANVNIPVPLAVAGVCLCLLGGYVIGAVAGPQAADQAVATVQSYGQDERRLCLAGDTVSDEPGAVDGVLCGEWRRTVGATKPSEGDSFRFVAIERSDGDESTVYIYGDVVDDQ